MGTRTNCFPIYFLSIAKKFSLLVRLPLSFFFFFLSHVVLQVSKHLQNTKSKTYPAPTTFVLDRNIQKWSEFLPYAYANFGETRSSQRGRAPCTLLWGFTTLPSVLGLCCPCSRPWLPRSRCSMPQMACLRPGVICAATPDQEEIHYWTWMRFFHSLTVEKKAQPNLTRGRQAAPTIEPLPALHFWGVSPCLFKKGEKEEKSLRSTVWKNIPFSVLKASFLFLLQFSANFMPKVILTASQSGERMSH